MRQKTILTVVLLVFLLSASLVFTQFVNLAQAATGNVSGFAWSSNIGWISFKGVAGGTNYGLNFVDDPDDSGRAGFFTPNSYVWSSNIGWINFSSDYSGSYPDTDTANHHGVEVESDGSVTGWARACSVFGPGTCLPVPGNCPTEPQTGMRCNSERGGWDGWIKMNATSDPTKNVHLVGNEFRGYAWGATVVGWIDFCPTSGTAGCVSLDSITPICSAIPSPAELSAGTVSVVWSASDPQPVANYKFDWSWVSDLSSSSGDLVPVTDNNSVTKAYTQRQGITGILTATDRNDSSKKGTGTCYVDVTNPNQKELRVSVIGGDNSGLYGNVTGTGGINCGANGNTCTAAYSNGQSVTLTETPDSRPAPANIQFQGWSASPSVASCSGNSSTCVVPMNTGTIVTAAFYDANAAPAAGTLSVSSHRTRITDQLAGSSANSGLVNISVNNTGSTPLNVCLVEVNSKVNNAKLESIISGAIRAFDDPRTSNVLPECSFDNRPGSCSDNCVSDIRPNGPGSPTVLPFFITIPEKFYEIKQNSPYDVRFEVRDGINPLGVTLPIPGLEFRYEVSDVFPR